MKKGDEILVVLHVMGGPGVKPRERVTVVERGYPVRCHTQVTDVGLTRAKPVRSESNGQHYLLRADGEGSRWMRGWGPPERRAALLVAWALRQ